MTSHTARMNVAATHALGPLSLVQTVVWFAYLIAAVMLPAHHIRPIIKYLRGNSGIGDACLRTELLQCGWRVPALLFATVVAPSLPLFLSIFLDLIGRLARVMAMQVSKRRWELCHAHLSEEPAKARLDGRAAGANTDTRGRHQRDV